MILVTVLIGFTFPLWLVAAAALSPLLPGRWRPLRVLWVAILYLVCESVLLVILFGLWVSSGLGRRIRTPYYEGIHYDLVQGLLWIFFREARRVLNLTIETAGPTPDAYPGRPLLVCCRHGGPGDSFMLIYALMHWYDREPRVVLKDTLAWDPAIDVLLHRIPARFISPNPGAGERIEDQIAELASGLDENDAFVIFPEGGNFTPRRRERAIERLHKLGMHRMADARRGDDQRARAATRRLPGRARRRPRRRRGDGRPHRHGPHAHRRRRLARAADGQAAADAVVAGPARRDPGRPRRPRSTGSSAGGNGSTSGSTSTGRRTCPARRRRSRTTAD